MDKLLVKADISILRDGTCITMQCAKLKRTLDISTGTVATSSLSYNGQCLSQPTAEQSKQDFNFFGMMPANEKTPYDILSIEAQWIEASYKSAEHAILVIVMKNRVSRTIYTRTYFMYPGISAIGVETAIDSPVSCNGIWSYRRGDDAQLTPGDLPRESCQDSLALAFTPSQIKSVEYFGRTDVTDTLYKEHIVQDKANGNLLFVQSSESYGIIYLQEAPPSTERRDRESHDFRIEKTEQGIRVYSCGWGIPPEEAKYAKQPGYRHVLLAYDTPQQISSTIKTYLKSRYPMDKEHCGTVLVNPWGCGKFPDYVCEDFLKEEIKAAAKAGAQYYQIDDSWEQGGTLGDLAVYNTKITPEFWQISDKLHNSFSGICGTAKEAGVKLGLWFAPSFNNEYDDWENASSMLLDMHRKYGFDVFKIDAVITPTKKSEDNLRKMLETVKDATNGKVFFNLDTTSGMRPGYFMFLEYGNIFLENRYVCHLWGLGYHPDKTLHSLWNLSRYLRPQFLQIEVPSADDINAEFYSGRKSPDIYDTEYWAAISLFSSPLLWCAPSKCSKKTICKTNKIMSLHKQLWPEIAECEVYPIGNEPDGKSITGFQAHNHDTGNGYLLFFRESDCNYSAADIYPQESIGDAEYSMVYDFPSGISGLEADSRDFLRLSLPEKASFTIWKYDNIKK